MRTPRRGLRCALLIGLAPAVLGAANPGQDARRAPVPDAAAQGAAEKLIKQVFKEDYAKRDPPDRIALAKKLLQQAHETKDDAAPQYVLFVQAGGLAAEAGDIDLCFQTIDETAKSFAIDVVSMKNDALQTVEKNAKTPEEFMSVAKARLRLADEAVNADEYEIAEKNTAAAAALARRAKDMALAARASGKSKAIAARKTSFGKVKKAQETLAANPDDSAANLTVGHFLCLVKGQWPTGLAMLAKCSDESLKGAALKDLASPADASGQMALGDVWWQLAEKEKDVARSNLRHRALGWYLKAVPGLGGIAKTRIERRIVEARVESLLKGTWIDVNDPRLFKLQGKPGDTIKIESESLEAKMVEHVPSGDFDSLSLRVSFDNPNPKRRIYVDYEEGRAKHCAAIHRELFWTLTGFDADQKSVNFTAKCVNKDEYVVTMLQCGNQYVVYLDGEEKGRHPSSGGRLGKIILAGDNGAFTFDQIRVRQRE